MEKRVECNDRFREIQPYELMSDAECYFISHGKNPCSICYQSSHGLHAFICDTLPYRFRRCVNVAR